MKLCRFTRDGATRIGKVVEGRVIELTAVVGADVSMRELLAKLPARRVEIESVNGRGRALEALQLHLSVNGLERQRAIATTEAIGA